MTAVTDFIVDHEVELVRKRRRFPTFFLVLIILAVAAAAIGLVRYGAFNSPVVRTDDAMLQADNIPVISRLSGRVGQMLVSENSAVTAGAAIAQIDPSDVDLRLNAAEGRVQALEAGAGSAQARIAEASGAVSQAYAETKEAAVGLMRLNGTINRYRPLIRLGAEPAEKLADLEAERSQMLAQLASRRAAVGVAQARLAGARAEAVTLRAQVGTEAANRDGVMIDKSATQITAPSAGRLAQIAVHEGQFIQAGQKVATLVAVRQAYVVANFKETQIARLRIGQPARVYLDALPDVAINGTIESVAPGTKASFALLPAQNASGNYTRIVQRVPVRIRITPTPAVERLMLSGLSAAVEIDTESTVKPAGK